MPHFSIENIFKLTLLDTQPYAYGLVQAYMYASHPLMIRSFRTFYGSRVMYTIPSSHPSLANNVNLPY